MSMSYDVVLQKVKEILRSCFNFPDEQEINLSDLISKDLGAESIDHLDIMFQVERFFRVKIKEENLKIWDVQALVNYVMGNVNKG